MSGCRVVRKEGLKYNQIVENAISTFPCGKLVGIRYSVKAIQMHKKLCELCKEVNKSTFTLDLGPSSKPSRKLVERSNRRTGRGLILTETN